MRKSKNIIFLILITVLTAGFIAQKTVSAQDDAVFTDAQKQELQKMFNEHLMENGDVIMKAVEEYRKRQMAEDMAKAEKRLSAHKEYLTRADAPSAGNPDGEILVVEFFDYNCGYCKKALPDIQEVLKKYDNVRVVFQEMPILSSASREAAKWALAAHEQGKYFDYHAALMNHRGTKNDQAYEKMAKDLGLDVGKMKKFVNSKEAEEAIQKSISVASDIGVRGTPAFIVNDQLHRGYLGDGGLKRVIDEAKEKG